MDNISSLLTPNAAPTLKALPIMLTLLIAFAAAFLVYLVRCYLVEWRIQRKMKRRAQRARARYATAPPFARDSLNDSASTNIPEAEAA